MLTMGSGVYHVTPEIVRFIFSAAGLDLYVYPYGTDTLELREMCERVCWMEQGSCWMWQDRQTGGGGCRLVANKELTYLWVSSHSGYSHADFTEAVKEMLVEYGAKEVAPHTIGPRNPYVYGDRF